MLDTAFFPGRAAHAIDALNRVAVSTIGKCGANILDGKLNLPLQFNFKHASAAVPWVIKAGLCCFLNDDISAVRIFAGIKKAAVALLKFDQTIELHQVSQRHLHQESYRVHMGTDICHLDTHTFKEAFRGGYISFLERIPELSFRVPLCFGKPDDAGPVVNFLIIAAVPARIDGIENVVIIAISGIDHDIHAERLVQEVLFGKKKVHQLAHQLFKKFLFIRREALGIWAIIRSEFRADFVLHLGSQLDFIIKVPLVQLLPKALHGIFACENFYGGGIVHLVTIIGINFIREAAGLVLVKSNFLAENFHDALLHLFVVSIHCFPFPEWYRTLWPGRSGTRYSLHGQGCSADNSGNAPTLRYSRSSAPIRR